MVKNTIQDLAEKLFSETDGNKFARIKDKLIKDYGDLHTSAVLALFIRYAQEGRLLHWRNFLLTDIIRLVPAGDETYVPFFEWTITVPELTYWGIDGLLKTNGTRAYDTLITLAGNGQLAISTRAKAIKSLAVHSQQPFDRELPVDPGYWKITDLRLDEISAWQQHGYATGAGYAPPATHPALHQPVTKLDHIAARLEAKLKERREDYQDLSRPTDWLVPATEADMAAIERKWKLPADYHTFLRQFSPLQVMIEDEDLGGSVDLYGAAELIARQDGYAYNAVKQETIIDWPAEYVVIADMGGDPCCIDLNSEQGAIYTSMHGAGTWEFDLYADSFLEFLEDLSHKA